MKKIQRFLATFLIACIAGSSLPLEARAGMIATPADAQQRGRIAAFVDRQEVHARLEAYGVSRAEVQARVASLTDEEAALVAERIDELPAGGVVGLILTIFLVLLITDLLGLTKVFPFTKAVCDRGKC
jgi:hypothetical protein